MDKYLKNGLSNIADALEEYEWQRIVNEMDKTIDLSILITSYNNASFIADVIDRVRINFPNAEIIIVDDCSTDGSDEILEELDYSPNIKVWWNSFNMGYGFSLKQGIKLSYNKYIAFQDSDMEYNPTDIKPLYRLVVNNDNIDVAYGRRSHYRIKNPLNRLGRLVVNGLFCILYGFKIRDVSTAYKVLPRQLLLDLDIQANDFRFSIEIGAKLCISGCKIVEVPVSFHPRTVEEGKKIRFRDGFDMIIETIKWKFK